MKTKKVLLSALAVALLASPVATKSFAEGTKTEAKAEKTLDQLKAEKIAIIKALNEKEWEELRVKDYTLNDGKTQVKLTTEQQIYRANESDAILKAFIKAIEKATSKEQVEDISYEARTAIKKAVKGLISIKDFNKKEEFKKDIEERTEKAKPAADEKKEEAKTEAPKAKDEKKTTKKAKMPQTSVAGASALTAALSGIAAFAFKKRNK